MTKDPKEPPLLAPLADAYDSTLADAERVFAQLRTSIEAEPSTSALGTATARGWVAKLSHRATLSTMALALGSGLALYQGRATLASVTPASSPRALVEPEPASTPVPEAAPAEPASGDVPTISVDALPTVYEGKSDVKASPDARRAVAARPSDDTLAREVRLLADARRALQAGDVERALALLDEHARTFPNGWLASDRSAERIEVLCRLGRRADAAAETSAFMARHPTSLLAQRVAATCAVARDE